MTSWGYLWGSVPPEFIRSSLNTQRNWNWNERVSFALKSHNYCSILVSSPLNVFVENRETGTAECLSLPTSLTHENGGIDHANGNGSQTVNGGQLDHGSQHGDGGHPGDGADADGGQPAAVLPSPDSPAACAEAHTKW